MIMNSFIYTLFGVSKPQLIIFFSINVHQFGIYLPNNSSAGDTGVRFGSVRPSKE